MVKITNKGINGFCAYMQKTEENMKKKTDDLVNEIISSKTMNHYLNTNQEEFLEMPLHVYLKQLLEKKQMRVSQVADASNKGEYIYQVFRGIKRPSRDVVLCIAMGMKLNQEETNYLLRVAGVSPLDARKRRDSIILFALNRSLTVPDTNDILDEFQEPCL